MTGSNARDAPGRSRLPPTAPGAATGLVICSPVAIYAEGLQLALARLPRLRVLAVACDGPGCLDHVTRLRPDVVLLDFHTHDTLALIETLVALEEAPKVVVLGIDETESGMIPCVEAGAAGWVTRGDSIADLRAAIEAVERGETRCSARSAAILVRCVARRAEPGGLEGGAGARRNDVRLTRRETEVLGLVGEGLSNKQIARRLSIELPTVKNHVHNILEKLHVGGRSEAVAWLHTVHGRRAIQYLRPLEAARDQYPG